MLAGTEEQLWVVVADALEDVVEKMGNDIRGGIRCLLTDRQADSLPST